MDNRETVSLYLEERRANQLSEETIRHDRTALEQLSEFLGKPFKDASKRDLIQFFSHMQQKRSAGTVHLRKVKVKQFYNWLYDLDRGEYPACVKWIRPTNPNKGKLPIQPEDLLTREEVRKLIEACNDARNQALISTGYETAARAGELLDLKNKNVNFDEQGGVVALKGKTGQRRIRLVESIPYLQAWLNIHPLRGNPNAPLWMGKSGGIGYHYLYELLKRLTKKAGIKKKVTPHVFRHSRLTELARHLPEQKLKVYAGWTPDSKMASVYVHLSGKDLDQDILGLHGLETEKREAPFKQTPLTPTPCPRCQQKNPPTAMYCQFCGMILDEKTALEVMETTPLHKILREGAKEIMKCLKEKDKAEVRAVFDDFLSSLTKEVERSAKDAQQEHARALKEIRELRKLVEERLKD